MRGVRLTMNQIDPTRFFLNRDVDRLESKPASPLSEPLAFHQRLPGYAATPLIDVPPGLSAAVPVQIMPTKLS